MLSIILGIATILLGAKAFTPAGLPLTNTKRLTGVGGKITGVICILLGVAFFAEGIWAMSNLGRR